MQAFIRMRRNASQFCLIHGLFACYLLPNLILPIWVSPFCVKEGTFFKNILNSY